MQPVVQYCLYFKLRKMKGKMDDVVLAAFNLPVTLVKTIGFLDSFDKIWHRFPTLCAHFLDLSKSGRATLNTRLKLWRMYLVGKLVKASTTQGNGCLQQPVSYDPMSGDFVSNTLICGWHVVCLEFVCSATYPHMGSCFPGSWPFLWNKRSMSKFLQMICKYYCWKLSSSLNKHLLLPMYLTKAWDLELDMSLPSFFLAYLIAVEAVGFLAKTVLNMTSS